jgi:hypothetical protein
MITRVANFSSSSAHRLIGVGKRPMTKDELAARPKKGVGSSVKQIEDPKILGATTLSYIKEKVREEKLMRSLESESHARSLTWGKVMERYVFERKLDMNYRDGNQQGRVEHQTIARWNGIPDALRATIDNNIVGDIKCPWSLTAYCDTVEAIKAGLDVYKVDKADNYWQLVSNACLLESKLDIDFNQGESIIYVPYVSELPDIRDWISQDFVPEAEGLTPFLCEWIYNQIVGFLTDGQEPSFPYLMDASEYTNLTSWTFDIPQTDKELLTSRVEMAVKELNKQLNNK